MRTVAVETSSLRGTVSLVECSRVVGTAEHSRPNAHGEALLGLLETARSQAGWSRSSIDQIAVGIGPGSFTGLRVGIAFAQGLGIGLGRPVRGVGSLRAMAAGLDPSHEGLRCPVLDARRGEVFVAAYDAGGREHLAPSALCPEAAWAALGRLGRAFILLGEGASLLPSAGAVVLRDPLTDLPHATSVGRIAEQLGLSGDAEPLYIRPADAIRPNLPPSPLSSTRVDP